MLGQSNRCFLCLYYTPIKMKSAIIAIDDRIRGLRLAPASNVAFNTILILQTRFCKTRQENASLKMAPYTITPKR